MSYLTFLEQLKFKKSRSYDSVLKMQLIVKLLIFLGLVTISIAQSTYNPHRVISPGRIVTTNDGDVQGSEELYNFIRKIHTYKGIPYARPPVGNLRFKAPLPVVSWNGIYQATKFGPKCPQILTSGKHIGKYAGEEDCLYINVFTPEKIEKPLPVLFNIHGGGFYFGSGDTDVLGPETFIEENVIFVSINYRLGPLGFLASGDKLAPGNYGLKDMILALQWVNKNIQAFGGYPIFKNNPFLGINNFYLFFLFIFYFFEN
jgi:hypothetical protein